MTVQGDFEFQHGRQPPHGSLLLHREKMPVISGPVVCVCVFTQSFRCNATAGLRVAGPVVVLQTVHQLQHCPNTADGGVDGCRADKLCRQVRVQ